MQNRKRTKEETIDEFIKYCEIIEYGEAKIEIANGIPIRIVHSFKDVRLDLKREDLTKNK